uniref:Arrestin_N domain-containing protein n=1 Tax=Heligmosomoides polygyrus TaxID=6339 RepID=A0A8L8KUU3_HELPZ
MPHSEWPHNDMDFIIVPDNHVAGEETVNVSVEINTVFRSTVPFAAINSMPDLPKECVTRSRPFQTVGLDYLGPIPFKATHTVASKAWVCQITCLATRVVHLELVLNNLSKNSCCFLQLAEGREISFIAIIRLRFTLQRKPPQKSSTNLQQSAQSVSVQEGRRKIIAAAGSSTNGHRGDRICHKLKTINSLQGVEQFGPIDFVSPTVDIQLPTSQQPELRDKSNKLAPWYRQSFRAAFYTRSETFGIWTISQHFVNVISKESEDNDQRTLLRTKDKSYSWPMISSLGGNGHFESSRKFTQDHTA